MNSFISFLKNWGDIILSGLVAVGGIFAYFKHDKKLKEQEFEPALSDSIVKF